MAALAFRNKIQTINSIHLDWSSVLSTEDGFPLAEELRARTLAVTTVVYLLLPRSCELRAIAAQSGLPTRVRKASSTIGTAMSDWLDSLAVSVQGSPSEGPFLERFPEAMQHRLKQLAVFPLRHGDLLGLLTIGRVSDTPLEHDDIETAVRAAQTLGHALGRDSLRHQVSERMWVQRAREILRTPDAAPLVQNPHERFTMFHIAKEVAGA